MATPNRFSSSLGQRSIFARIVAVLALAACGVAIYLVVMSFTNNEGGDDSKSDKKGRSEQKAQAPNATSYTVATGDTLTGIGEKTGIPAQKIERLNPDLDAETLNAGQVLVLR